MWAQLCSRGHRGTGRPSVWLRSCFLLSPALYTAGLRRAKPAQRYSEITDWGSQPTHSLAYWFAGLSAAQYLSLGGGNHTGRGLWQAARTKSFLSHWARLFRPAAAADSHLLFLRHLPPLMQDLSSLQIYLQTLCQQHTHTKTFPHQWEEGTAHASHQPPTAAEARGAHLLQLRAAPESGTQERWQSTISCFKTLRKIIHKSLKYRYQSHLKGCSTQKQTFFLQVQRVCSRHGS